MTDEHLPRSLLDLPHALDDGTVDDRLGGRRPVVFLDYDGTLTPIVDDPAAATLAPEVRRAVADLAAVVPVAIVSGRDRADVETLVGLDLFYAGSHGFDIAGPGFAFRHPEGEAAQEALAAAADELDRNLGAIEGAIVERKAFAVAVHFRMVSPVDVEGIDAVVDRVVTSRPGLRRTTGKMIFELRPDIDWDKGRALEFLRRRLELDGPDTAPIYIGDDDTDEDALAVVADDGLGVIVGTADRPTWAHVRLSDPREVVGFLTRLTSREAARTSGEI